MKLPIVFKRLVTVVILAAIPVSVEAQQSAVYEGFTEPYYDLMVAATEIGRVEEVFVQAGDKIKRGQTIARLEDSMQAASVRIAKLQSEMKGEVEAAKAEVFLHRTRTIQVRELAKEKMARPDEVLRAEADLQISEARYKAAQEQDRLRKLELERYRLQLERRKVVSPMDGVVAKVFHHPGEYITPSDPAVVRLLVTDKLYAVFNIPVEETDRLKVGTDVRVFLRSSAKTVTAAIHSLSPAIDGESGTLQIRIELPNEGNIYRAGDRCTMQIAPSKRAARLPKISAEPKETEFVMGSLLR